jgi:hypothetical protein
MGIKVVFGVERDDAEFIAKGIFLPDVDKIREEGKTNTQHSIYDPLPNQWEAFTQLIDKKSLPAREAYVVCHNRPVIKIRTMDVHDRNCSNENLELIKRYSVMKWGRPIEAVKIEIEQRLNQQPKTPFYMGSFLAKEEK